MSGRLNSHKWPAKAEHLRQMNIILVRKDELDGAFYGVWIAICFDGCINDRVF